MAQSRCIVPTIGTLKRIHVILRLQMMKDTCFDENYAVSKIVFTRSFDLDVIEIWEITIGIQFLDSVLSLEPSPRGVHFSKVLLDKCALWQSTRSTTDDTLALIDTKETESTHASKTERA